ncbi:tRNA-dihydrouridine synthase [Candidatus Peregrinibacteria bacterium]|nr:MAG: tRNA-dihydrouridine synthase [Candidatus Peregrinibacteria bacterium]
MNQKPSFSWNTWAQKGPLVALAPMDGYTDSAYRQIVKIIEPKSIVFCEFVSADGLSRAPKKMSRIIEFNPAVERPYIVQVFGKNPEAFAEAAKFIEEFGADGIDINYGCPAKKVIGSGHGSDLIRNPCLAAEIVASIKKSVRIPVSVKTRLGWENSETLLDFAKNLISAGAEMLTIHGRTVKQSFSGSADWNPIYELKMAFPHIPILGNGDIRSGEDAHQKIKNLNGVMIGRGSFGNPWIFREVACALSGETYRPPSPEEVGNIIRRHAEILIQTKGQKRAMLEFRKHLLSFTKGFSGARELRGQMTSIENLNDIEGVVTRISSGLSSEKISEETKAEFLP